MDAISEKEMERRYAGLAHGAEAPASGDFRDRCKGAIIGTAVGDALFAPIEFTQPMNHSWISGMTGGGAWGLEKGSYTDDTSMALCIMDGYLESGGADCVRNIARKFVKWMREGLWSVTGRCFDVGTSCRHGIEMFEQTGSLENGQYATGCGGLMRFAPSWMVEYAESGGRRNRKRCGAMERINNIDHFSGECLSAVRKLARVYDSHILDGRRTDERSECWSWRNVPAGWNAEGCLDRALWAFNNTRNFRDAVLAAGNCGGDADSVAAVCGGMAGAYYGYCGIPEEWLRDLRDRERIETLADSFLNAAVATA